MRITLVLRPDAGARPGGDIVQAEAIATYLAELGHQVSRDLDLAPCPACDLAFLFNLTRPEQTWLQAQALIRHRIPYALVPVYWDLEQAVPRPPPEDFRGWLRGVLPPALLERRRLVRHALDAAAAVGTGRALRLAGAGSSQSLCRQVLAAARWVLPNSEAEQSHLAERFALRPDQRWRVVRSGVWLDELDQVPRPETRRAAVFCAGALGPRKNQRALVRAARRLAVPVFLAGAPGIGCERYVRDLHSEAPANLHVLGHLPRSEVLSRMAATAVYVQPSFIETPGLALLEAAVLGCAVIAADCAPVREYLGGCARLIDPTDPDALAAAIGASLAGGVPPGQIEAMRQSCDWRAALEPLRHLLTEV